MAFVRKSGKTKVMWLPVTASTVIADGSLVAWASGLLVPATNTVDSFYIAGVCRKTIAATDTDYATSGRLIPVEVPVEKNVVFTGDVTQGTLLTTSVGLYFDLSTDDLGEGVDQGASALDIALCVGYISGTKGLFQLNMGVEGKVKA